MEIDNPTARLNVKYADVLGKPLNKSIYRQLDQFGDFLYMTDPENEESFIWKVTVHGRVNWCPPGCRAEIACTCTGQERKCPHKNTRPHQHILISSDGRLYSAFCYNFISTRYEDAFPWRRSVWKEYEPLQTMLNQSDHGKPEQMRAVATQMRTVEMKACHEFMVWLRQEMDKLPVILLR